MLEDSHVKESSGPIYLDYNATTPIAPEVASEMTPFLTHHFGNPSSTHVFGRICKEAIEEARRRVARLIGCTPHEVVFTSGGTESNNYAIRGYVDHVLGLYKERGSKQRVHIITSVVEHPAVMEVCRFLEREYDNRVRVTYVNVDKEGVVDMSEIAHALSSDTILVSIMHANNEVGTIQPMNDIAKLVQTFDKEQRSHMIEEHRNIKPPILIHTDCAQSVGKIAVNLLEMEVDMITIAGHKLYAPKGVGCLIVGTRVPGLHNLMHGASHERCRRPGTENVLGIVGLGAACQLLKHHDQITHQTHIQEMRDSLQQGLTEYLEKEGIKFLINGHPTQRLPNTLSISIENLHAPTLLSLIQNDVAASAGSACHSDGQIGVSAVLTAMNIPTKFAVGTLRLSTGKYTKREEIKRALNIIVNTIENHCDKLFIKE